MKPSLEDLYSQRAQITQKMVQRYYEEYLNELRERHARSKEKGEDTAASVGDIVLIHSDQPRKFWSLGLVTELVAGPDNKPRMAKVKTAHGETTRGLPKLYPIGVHAELELDHQEQDIATEIMDNENGNTETMGEENEITETGNENRITERSKRQAAVKATERIQALLLDDEDDDDE